MQPRSHETAPLDGRTAAVSAVDDALHGRRFAHEALREMRASGDLTGREAGFAMELAQGAIRHLLTIEHVLGAVAQYDKRRTRPTIRSILTTAAYQMIWMDRVPPFAAVDRAVDLAKQLAGRRTPGMVNAVLRRLGRAIAERRAAWVRLDPTHIRVAWDQACVFKSPVLPHPGGEEHDLAYFASAAAERPQRLRTLIDRHGWQEAEAVTWASQAVPVTVLQRNPVRATPDAFECDLRTATEGAAEFVGDTAFVPAATAVMDLTAFRDGLIYAQDTTAHAAVVALDAQRGEAVLDLCAAPGGKSIALALAMHDWGKIVACDVDGNRLKQLDASIARLGLNCIRIRTLSRNRADLTEEGLVFDAAIVDAPCSNTGVIARRPEARLGLTREKLVSLVELQQGLLGQAASCVRPDGRLVYSTCSIEPEENEQVVAAFVEHNPQWRLELERTVLPAWGPRLCDWRDGGYHARLRRG